MFINYNNTLPGFIGQLVWGPDAVSSNHLILKWNYWVNPFRYLMSSILVFTSGGTKASRASSHTPMVIYIRLHTYIRTDIHRFIRQKWSPGKENKKGP